MSNRASKSKRARIAHPPGQIANADSLRWKKVARPTTAGFGAFDHEGGILDLEEVDGVEVIFEEIPGGGRKVMFRTADVKAPEEKDGESDGIDVDDFVLSGEIWEAELEEARRAGENLEVDQEEDEGMSEGGGDEEDAEPWGGIVDDESTADEAVQQEPAAAEESVAGPSRLPATATKAATKATTKAKAETAEVAVAPPVDDSFDDSLLPNWSQLEIHSLVKRSLFNLGFHKPSPIQAAALPLGLNGRDVVGVAETGSGKTLAYGLPLLSHCFSLPPPAASKPGVKTKRSLQALILAPTRELALQVTQHLQKAVDAALVVPKTVGEGEGDDAAPAAKPAGPPRVSVGTIVGGMSAQKQKRVLERGVDILVATPGRLWDLIGENESIARSIRNISFLIIDEADRMIETGHFKELESIVNLTHRPDEDASKPATSGGKPAFEDLSREEERDSETAREAMQTFVFSATLSKDLQRNLKRFSGKPREGGKGKFKQYTTLEDLFDKLDFRDEEPEVIDLSPADGVVSTLQEAKIECMANEKDLYLYYFLLRYPGRSLIFFGSIDAIRRAVPLLELLKFPVFPLHSQLQQKQRLKNLDRFKTAPHGILLATDIAARGLDIPSVDHVIHYQLPRSADVLVHRSGRTARANTLGFSLQLCSPEEKRVQRALMRSLGRDDELPELPIEHGMLDKLKQRIFVARQIDQALHKVKKDNHEKSWIKEAAEAFEIDLDSDDMPSDLDDDKDRPVAQTKKGHAAKVGALKAELRALLAEPLVARGISQRYITSGSRKIVDALLAGTQHSTMMGMETSTAAADAAQGKTRKRKVAPTATLAAAENEEKEAEEVGKKEGLPEKKKKKKFYAH